MNELGIESSVYVREDGFHASKDSLVDLANQAKASRNVDSLANYVKSITLNDAMTRMPLSTLVWVNDEAYTKLYTDQSKKYSELAREYTGVKDGKVSEIMDGLSDGHSRLAVAYRFKLKTDDINSMIVDLFEMLNGIGDSKLMDQIRWSSERIFTSAPTELIKYPLSEGSILENFLAEVSLRSSESLSFPAEAQSKSILLPATTSVAPPPPPPAAATPSPPPAEDNTAAKKLVTDLKTALDKLTNDNASEYKTDAAGLKAFKDTINKVLGTGKTLDAVAGDLDNNVDLAKKLYAAFSAKIADFQKAVESKDLSKLADDYTKTLTDAVSAKPAESKPEAPKPGEPGGGGGSDNGGGSGSGGSSGGGEKEEAKELTDAAIPAYFGKLSAALTALKADDAVTKYKLKDGDYDAFKTKVKNLSGISKEVDALTATDVDDLKKLYKVLDDDKVTTLKTDATEGSSPEIKNDKSWLADLTEKLKPLASAQKLAPSSPKSVRIPDYDTYPDDALKVDLAGHQSSHHSDLLDQYNQGT